MGAGSAAPGPEGSYPGRVYNGGTAMSCGYCDAALTRAALLALRLQKLGAMGHQGHPGARFDECELEPCKKTTEVLRYAGLYESRRVSGASGDG